MKIHCLVAALLATATLATATAAFAQTAPVVQPANAIFPYDKHVETLPNGMTLVVVPMKSPGLVAYYTLVRVGSRNEVEKGHSGFAHFFEHMMFRGTKLYSPDKRDAFLKTIGADDNAFTTDDFTCYTVFGASNRMEDLIKIEADRIQNLSYGKSEFQTEARAVKGEYNKNFSNPEEKMIEKLQAAAFTKHTYRHTTMGFVEDIDAMPGHYEYAGGFFKRFYRPDNVTLYVVGDIDPARISALVKQSYGAWSGKGELAKIAVEPPQTKERRVDLKWDAETAPRIMIGWHTPAQNLTHDEPAQYVVGTYLFGKASRLYKDLVLDRALVESIGDYSSPHRDPNLQLVGITLKDEKDRKVVFDTIQKAIEDLANGNVDAKLLKDVVSNTRYSVLTNLETPNQVADTMVFVAGPSGQVDGLEKIMALEDKITPESVSAFAKKYLVPANRTVVQLTSAASKGGAK